jgi:hypothetical protein
MYTFDKILIGKNMWNLDVKLSIKITAFWDVALCSLRVDQRFRGAYCLHHQGDE